MYIIRAKGIMNFWIFIWLMIERKTRKPRGLQRLFDPKEK
jgi:hypothetical protein